MLRPGMRTDRLAAPRLHPTPRLFGDSPRDVTRGGGLLTRRRSSSQTAFFWSTGHSVWKEPRYVPAQIIILDYRELIWAADRIGGSGRESNWWELSFIELTGRLGVVSLIRGRLHSKQKHDCCWLVKNEKFWCCWKDSFFFLRSQVVLERFLEATKRECVLYTDIQCWIL